MPSKLIVPGATRDLGTNKELMDEQDVHGQRAASVVAADSNMLAPSNEQPPTRVGGRRYARGQTPGYMALFLSAKSLLTMRQASRPSPGTGATAK